MRDKRNRIEFSSKVVGVITAIITLISVVGSFYNNLKNYVEASGYFGYFSIDLRYVDISFYSNSYNFITQLLICFLQWADAFFIFNLLRRIFTNRHIERMVSATGIRKNQQKKLNKVFYINRDGVLNFMDVSLFILLFIAVYVFQIFLSGDLQLFLREGIKDLFNLQRILANIWSESIWVLNLFFIYVVLVEIHFLFPEKVRNNIETVNKIIEINSDSSNGEEFENKIKEINDYISYERKLSTIRLFISALLVVIGVTIGVGLPFSYFVGVNKARSQREFWVTEQSVAFQIDNKNYMMLGYKMSEDEEGNCIISINPHQMGIFSTSGLVVEKRKFEIVEIE